MTSNKTETCIRQAAGVFYDETSLKSTIDELLASGFQRSELALLASEQVVEQSLGKFYERINTDSDTLDSPGIAFVSKDAIGETAHSLGGSLSFVVVVFVMGALVLASALLGGAMLTAIVGVVAVLAIGALAATVSRQSNAQKLKEQVDKGHMLLFVRVADAKREKEVMTTLRKHSAVDVRMYNAPLKPHEEPEPQGLSF